MARQIADALDNAHKKGVVHRDLKPGNIKIRRTAWSRSWRRCLEKDPQKRLRHIGDAMSLLGEAPPNPPSGAEAPRGLKPAPPRWLWPPLLNVNWSMTGDAKRFLFAATPTADVPRPSPSC